MAFLSFLFVPIVLIILWISALARNRKTGLAISALFFLLTCGIGFWSITQSRSSTAGIGILFLPFYGCVSGAFAWGFAILRKSSDVKRKSGAWLLLLMGFGVNSYLLYSGFQTIHLNKDRDLKQKARNESIEKNKKWIKENLILHQGQEEAWLESLVQEKKDDETFLLSILDQPELSTKTLDSLAEHKEMGVMLQVARHPKTSSATLEKIYATKQYPEYYYQALAMNTNTPPDILQKLHDHPSYMTNLDQNLAQNTSIKKETLLQIAQAKKVRTLWNVISNPVCDCDVIKVIGDRMDRSKLEDDYKDWDKFLEDMSKLKVKCQGL